MTQNYIQVLTYREAIDKVTKKPYFYSKKLAPDVTSIVSLFNNLDKIIEVIPENERWNVHYTLANCQAPESETKGLREFAYQEAIAFDLDGIDLDYQQEYINIFFAVTKLNPDKTLVACSGNGLHFIVATTRKITTIEHLNNLRPYYKYVCGEINEAIFNAGLKGNADPLTLSEKKTLRLPNTINRKPNKEDKKAFIIFSKIEYQDYDITSGIDLSFEKDTEGTTTSFVVDTQAVLDGCEFLKYCKKNPNKITEPMWRSALTVLAKLPVVGSSLCHEYSSGYKHYDYDETETKIASIAGLSGPHKCKTIENVFSGCKECKYYNKCSNPLQIKSESFITTQATGFHYVKRDSKGILKPDRPCYEDLVRYFESIQPYVVNARDRNIYLFNGKHWSMISEADLGAFATKHFMPTATNKMRAEFIGLCLSRNVVQPEFFEQSIFGKLNLNNGVLDVKTLTLTPHSPDYGFTHVLPYDYNPQATCPIFDQAMGEITMADRELEQVLLEYMGYIISGVDPAWGTKALILVGEGANGKSTFIEILRRLVGRGNYSTVGVKYFPDSNSVFGMVNKLLNVCEEESYDSLRDSTAFKNIVSGGETTIKQLYKEKYTSKIMCKVVVGCNAIPPTNDQSNATYRRMLIVPFNAVFSSALGNINKQIVQQITAELSGVLNRVLTAYVELFRRGEFFTPRASMSALEAYRKDNDIIGSFFEDCFVEDENGVTYVADVMSAYQEWRRNNNVKADYDVRQITRRTKTLYPRVAMGKTVKGRTYIGLRKLTSEDKF